MTDGPLELDGFNVRRVGRCSPESQSHIVDDPDATHTLCGVKVSSRPKSAGITWACWVQPAIDGHDPEWCEPCLYRWAQP